MKFTRLAGIAAAAITFGIGAVNVAPAWATDNIKVFGVQETLNGPNGLPYIGYTVTNLAPSSDPVPHRGTLYAANLVVDGFGTGTPPMIERFGARAQSGDFYPSIWGASNMDKLYFDVVGDIPNSVVWNDGIRDILAWVPGDGSTGPTVPEQGTSEVVPGSGSTAAAPMPAEGDSNIVATPNDIAPAPYQITEGEAAQPGFNAGGGHR
ncbi:MAG: DUF1942 domain-containing protein [Mycobacterium sp.]